MVSAEALPEERNAMSFSEEPEELPGLFEKMMSDVLSPSSKNGLVPNEQNEQPQISIQAVETSNISPGNAAGCAHTQKEMKSAPNSDEITGSEPLAQPNSVQFDTKILGKRVAISANGNSNTDKNFPSKTESANTASSTEIITNQMLGTAILASNTMDESNPETAAGSVSVRSQAPTTIRLIAIPVFPPPINQNSTVSTEVSIPTLSDDQMTPVVQVFAAECTNSFSGHETELPTKNIEQPTPHQTNQIPVPSTRGSEPQFSESQIAPIIQNANLSAARDLTSPSNNQELSAPVDPTPIIPTKAGVIFESQNPTSTKPDAATGAVTQPQSGSIGTTIAPQDISMKQVGKTNKIAGQTEKVLPGNVIFAARGNLSSIVSPTAELPTTTAVANLPEPNELGTLSMSPANPAETHADFLDRTEDMIKVNVMRLTDSGNSSMRVVIKPDAGTQLSLQLQQQGGSVEIQAVLQAGDFGHFNQQWADLQQRLEERGIRLAPLAGEATSTSDGGSETFQRQDQNGTEEMVPELAFAGTPAGIFTQDAAQTGAHQGWETWA